MQHKTWSLDSLPDSVGYDSSVRGTPSNSPTGYPRNRVRELVRSEPEKVDVAVQAEGVSDFLYIRNLKMLQAEIEERDKQLDEAVGFYKRQEWNIECLKQGLRHETEDKERMMKQVLERVRMIESLLWALREETAGLVKDRGIEATESLCRMLELQDEERLSRWLQQTVFPTDPSLLENIRPTPPPSPPAVSQLPPNPRQDPTYNTEASCSCAVM